MEIYGYIQARSANINICDLKNKTAIRCRCAKYTGDTFNTLPFNIYCHDILSCI